MTDWITAALMLIGGAFVLLAAVGVVRMPDLFSRMQAATKASTLGTMCMLLAAAIHFGELGVTTRALLIIAFVFLTAPVAAHVTARAAYSAKVPLWHGRIIDELRAQYDAKARESDGAAPDEAAHQEPASGAR